MHPSGVPAPFRVAGKVGWHLGGRCECPKRQSSPVLPLSRFLALTAPWTKWPRCWPRLACGTVLPTSCCLAAGTLPALPGASCQLLASWPLATSTEPPWGLRPIPPSPPSPMKKASDTFPASSQFHSLLPLLPGEFRVSSSPPRLLEPWSEWSLPRARVPPPIYWRLTGNAEVGTLFLPQLGTRCWDPGGDTVLVLRVRATSG